MRRILVALLAALGIVTMTAGTSSAINNGFDPTPDPRAASVAKIKSAGLCTGTLLSERWVLTAAHCLKYLPSGTVGFGVSGEEDKVRFKNTFQHPNMNIDIGLILLDEPVEGREHMTLNMDSDLLQEQDTGIVYGWGGEASKVGQLGGAPITIEVVDLVRQINLLKRSHLIEVSTQDDVFVVKGDSGGPMFMDHSPTTVSGVMSYLNRKTPNMPKYTPVHLGYDWLVETMATTGDTPTTSRMIGNYIGSVGAGSIDLVSGEAIKYIARSVGS